MSVSRVWAGFALVSVLAIAALGMTQQRANAQSAPKAEWRAEKATKSKTASKAKKAAASVAPATQLASEEPPSSPQANSQANSQANPLQASPAMDQSQDVLDVDIGMAGVIAAQGPKAGYASALSDEGILYDANGASPVGPEAATSRFGTFPADVKLVRTPERALAAGGSGSSWGTYTIQRGEMVLSAGRYISVWRREASGWRMISELAAGKTSAVPAAAAAIGVLPKRPASLARATPPPIGIPSTVPTPPSTPSSSQPAPGP